MGQAYVLSHLEIWGRQILFGDSVLRLQNEFNLSLNNLVRFFFKIKSTNRDVELTQGWNFYQACLRALVSILCTNKRKQKEKENKTKNQIHFIYLLMCLCMKGNNFICLFITFQRYIFRLKPSPIYNHLLALNNARWPCLYCNHYQELDV